MMKEKIRYGKVTQAEEFLFPDSELGVLPDKLRLAAAKNGRRGIQLLLPTLGEKAVCTFSSGDFTAEWYGMRAVPVEYNTGNGVAQGGGMVLMDPVEEKPPYAIRKAPFQVYDCLMPRPEGVVEAKDGRAAIYLCLVPGENIREGTCQAEVRVALEEGECRLLLEIEVYGVRIPEEEFQITNWFSIPAICRFHKTGQGEPAFWEVLKKYIALMRRARQTCFYIQLDKACVAGTDPYRFDFSYLKEMISLFFDSGMKYLEIGPLLSRGFRDDGSPDMFTGTFRCMAAPEVDLDSWEGYEITVRFIRALADFLRENGWDDKVMVHIHDEPDIHVDSEKTLESRKRQYYLTASILRKYLPRVRIIEAVSTSGFRGGIDIWVPGTAGYEADREGFLRLTDLGEEVWNYVCCGPQGFWLNRFLDFALIKNRLLFWGCEANRLTGFLHWGFNQFPEGMDPFQATSCPNDTGLGTNFPCGDSFLVYPGTGKEAWPGMRLEAQRRGAEDAELLKLLRKKDRTLHDKLMGRLFISNEKYCDDPQVMEEVYEELLRALS